MRSGDKDNYRELSLPLPLFPQKETALPRRKYCYNVRRARALLSLSVSPYLYLSCLAMQQRCAT